MQAFELYLCTTPIQLFCSSKYNSPLLRRSWRSSFGMTNSAFVYSAEEERRHFRLMLELQERSWCNKSAVIVEKTGVWSTFWAHVCKRFEIEALSHGGCTLHSYPLRTGTKTRRVQRSTAISIKFRPGLLVSHPTPFFFSRILQGTRCE